MTDAPEPRGPGYFRSKGWWRDETLPDWLSRNAGTRAQNDAIASFGGKLTCAELYDRAHRLAGGLAQLGIRRGDVVAVHLPNLPEFIVVWFAINICGAAMQTIHMAYGAREVERLLGHSGAKAIVVRSPAAELVEIADRLPALQDVIAVGDVPAGTIGFDTLLAFTPLESQAQADDPFLLLYTSGTTSAPKAVSVSYNHFLSNARIAAGEFGLTAEDRILCLAPFTHLYGLYTLELGFAVGAQACLVPMFTPRDLIEALKRFRPTVLFGAPGHIAATMQQRLFDGVDLSSLRIAVLSGTTVPPELSAAFEHRLPNGRVMQAWGMTELQFGTCGRPGDARDVRFNGVGRAMPGSELRVVDADMRVVDPGVTGELQIRGCSVFSGYVGNAAATAESFTADGWFRTGDLAEMDAGGNIRLRGRTKDIVNRGGVKFNPAEVEAALAGHPAIAEVAIAPLPDATLGERAACFVLLKDGQTLELEALKDYLAERKVAKFMWPEHLEIVTAMPMTPTRKIMKAELVRQMLARADGSRSAA